MHRKNLAKRINTMLTILLLLLLIPLFLTIFCQKMQLEELLGNVNRTAETEEDADMLFCIVAKEISADAPEECIKAQCVIARTNLKAAEEMGTELPGSMTMGELQELWGDYFSEAEGKIKEAIQETDGETLQYRNHYIYAAYHAVSAGNTRNMRASMLAITTQDYVKTARAKGLSPIRVVLKHHSKSWCADRRRFDGLICRREHVFNSWTGTIFCRFSH